MQQDCAHAASPLLSLPAGLRLPPLHASSAGLPRAGDHAASPAQPPSLQTSARSSPEFDSDQENREAEARSQPAPDVSTSRHELFILLLLCECMTTLTSLCHLWRLICRLCCTWSMSRFLYGGTLCYCVPKLESIP